MSTTSPPEAGPRPGPPPVIGGAPHPALRPYVLQYLQFARDLAPGETLLNRVSAVPQPFLALLWSGSVHVVLEEAGHAVPIQPLMLSGPVPRWRDHRYSGSLRAFFVHFASAGAPPLLHHRFAGLADLALPLDDLLRVATRAAARTWADQVMHAANFQARAAASDHFLLGLLKRARLRPDPVAAAAELIEQAAGLVQVADVAARLGVSERTLRRRFYEQTGLPPKRFVRIVRFRRVHAYLTHGPATTFAAAAARFGYADQAHLIRDWHEFAGGTPARFQPDERLLDVAVDPGVG